MRVTAVSITVDVWEEDWKVLQEQEAESRMDQSLADPDSECGRHLAIGRRAEGRGDEAWERPGLG